MVGVDDDGSVHRMVGPPFVRSVASYSSFVIANCGLAIFSSFVRRPAATADAISSKRRQIDEEICNVWEKPEIERGGGRIAKSNNEAAFKVLRVTSERMG